MEGAGWADIGACQAAFHTAFTVQHDRADPRLPDFESALAGDLALTAVDAVVEVDSHRLALFIIANNSGGAVFDDEVFERKVKLFLTEDGLGDEFRKGAVLKDRYFGLAIDGQGNGMGRAGKHANAAIDAFFLVHVYRGAFDHAPVLQFSFHMRERALGADDRTNLAANAAVEVPAHQIIARHHRTRDGHLVFGFGFLWNSAAHVSPKCLPAGR